MDNSNFRITTTTIITRLDNPSSQITIITTLSVKIPMPSSKPARILNNKLDSNPISKSSIRYPSSLRTITTIIITKMAIIVSSSLFSSK